jgi:hypothetical protein
MFALCTGTTLRPPVAWCSNCTQFQIFNPYVLCIANDSIKVYNLFDSKLKQEINLPQVKLIRYISEEKIFIISSQTQIFALNVASIASQMDQLLLKNQVDEALKLFELSNANTDKKDFDEVNFKNQN